MLKRRKNFIADKDEVTEWDDRPVRPSCHSCGFESLIRVGFHNLCRKCYDRKFTEEAIAYANGLDVNKVSKNVSMASPGRDWAYRVIELWEAGKYPSEYGYRLAKAALNAKEPEVETEVF